MTPSILADRDMARVGTTLNTLLDRLTEDRERVRRLAGQVISAQDEERARIARELHDSTAQMLAALMLQLGVAAKESTSPAIDERRLGRRLRIWRSRSRRSERQRAT